MTELNESRKNPNILQSVNNTFKAIEILTRMEEIGVTQLSRELGIGKSTAFRILTTLEMWGYVRKNESTSKYRLGMKFADIGSIVLSRREIVNYARPYLESLTARFNETTHLGILEDDYRIRFIDKVKGTSMFTMESLVGGTQPAYCTSMGKVILANLPRERISNYLQNVEFEKRTAKTISSKEELLKELDIVRVQGYAVDREESERGLTCYGTAIFDSSNMPIAAISVSGSTPKMTEDADNIVSELLKSSRNISKLIKNKK